MLPTCYWYERKDASKNLQFAPLSAQVEFALRASFCSPATVQSFRLLIPETEVSNPESVVRLQQAMEEKIASIPGVSSVALTNGVPMDGTSWNDPVFAKDRNYAEGAAPPTRR